jgi:hypothetical protein
MSDSVDNGGGFGGVDSFGGSVEASGSMGGIGGGNVNGSDGLSAGSGANGGDPAAGYATTAQDVAALGMVGAAGAIGGAPGALAGTFGLALFGLSPQQAAINLAHDMSLGLGTAVSANPSISMFASTTQDAPAAGTVANDGSPYFYAFAGSQ